MTDRRSKILASAFAKNRRLPAEAPHHVPVIAAPSMAQSGPLPF
jgi:hypothetical protein